MQTSVLARSVTAAVLLVLAFTAAGQSNFINASDAIYNSSGTVYGTTVTLSQNGYVGSFISLTAPSSVSFNVIASGLPGNNSILPTMSVVVDDTKQTWSVGSQVSTYTVTAALPAGTHFVRVQFDNALQAPGAELNVDSIQISGTNFANSSDPAVMSSNALAAADTYVQNFRQGTTTLNLKGIATNGAAVQINLVRHAFRFGEEVPGTNDASVEQYLAPNPAPGSAAAVYQAHFLTLFNSLSPGNAGKWAYDEPTRGDVTMQGVDDILAFAEQNHLRVRMHNMIWGSQQPDFPSELALECETPSVSGTSDPPADLMSAIQFRIGYYVQDRAVHFDALDVYNESAHTGAWQSGDAQAEAGYVEPDYWNIFGVSGIASIYNNVAQAASAAGNPGLRLFTNEYNVLQNSATQSGTADRYANWYRQHDESILAAGGALSAIGTEYYSVGETGTSTSVHNPAVILGTWSNLAVLGLPIELTEFGIQTPSGGTDNPQTDAQILEESMRLAFGNPAVQGFTLWGFWAGDVWSGAPDAVLYDSSWNITPAGKAYVNLMQQWNTQVSTTVSNKGQVTFRGFYGDYTLTTGGKTYTFSLVKRGQRSPALTLQQ